MLRPELQSMEDFVSGVDHIVEGQQKAAAFYFEDGSVEAAIPPLQALLHILVHGQWQGLGMKDPAFRDLFDRDAVLKSDWYQARLNARAGSESAHHRRGLSTLQQALSKPGLPAAVRRELERRLAAFLS
jgi:hypothetical protein